MALIFSTTNEGKLAEAKRILGVEVEGSGLEIPEIQSMDSVEVAVAKAKAYFAELKKPIFVEDNVLAFNALSGLPGTYINDFSKLLGNDGMIDLLRDKTDRSAYAQSTIVYCDEKGETHVFVGKVEGEITLEPKGDKGFGWDPIFIPSGETRTFAEMEGEEKDKYSMRRIALEEFKKWLDTNK